MPTSLSRIAISLLILCLIADPNLGAIAHSRSTPARENVSAKITIRYESAALASLSAFSGQRLIKVLSNRSRHSLFPIIRPKFSRNSQIGQGRFSFSVLQRGHRITLGRPAKTAIAATIVTSIHLSTGIGLLRLAGPFLVPFLPPVWWWPVVWLSSLVVMGFIEWWGPLVGLILDGPLHQFKPHAKDTADALYRDLRRDCAADGPLHAALTAVRGMAQRWSYWDVLINGKSKKTRTIFYLPWMTRWPALMRYLIVRRAFGFVYDNQTKALATRVGPISKLTAFAVWLFVSEVQTLSRADVFHSPIPRVAPLSTRGVAVVFAALNGVFWAMYITVEAIVCAPYMVFLLIAGLIHQPWTTLRYVALRLRPSTLRAGTTLLTEIRRPGPSARIVDRLAVSLDRSP